MTTYFLAALATAAAWQCHVVTYEVRVPCLHYIGASDIIIIIMNDIVLAPFGVIVRWPTNKVAQEFSSVRRPRRGREEETVPVIILA